MEWIKNKTLCVCSVSDSLENVLQQAKIVHGEKFSYDETIAFINWHTKLKVFCNSCKTFFYSSCAAHIKGKHGCPTCNLGVRFTREKFLELANKRFGYFDYSAVEYINCKTEVTITCKLCFNTFLITPDYHLNGAKGCPFCSNVRSYGEKFVSEWLTNNNYIFEREKRFDTCRDKLSLPFDFFIKDLRILIEVQGRQHYEFSRFFDRTEETYHRRLKHDGIKLNFAKQQEYNLILIDLRTINTKTQIYKFLGEQI